MWRLYRWFVLFTAIMFVGAQAIVGASQLTSRNFLASYRPLLPGQSTDGAAAFPCEMRVGMSKGIEVGLCQFEAEDGVFGRVTVVESNRIIQRLAFVVQADTLYLGDLVLCWGKPDMPAFTIYPDMSIPLNLRWRSQTYAAISTHSITVLDYFSPVSYLSLEPGALPCASSE
jgi:hypothetical protein